MLNETRGLVNKAARFKMLTQQDIDNAINTFEQEMQSAIQAARNSVLRNTISLSFNTSQLTTSKIKELAGKLPTGQKKEDKDAEFIYVFSFAKNNKAELSKALSAFQSAREWQTSEEYKGKKNLCRPNPEHDSTTILYVGRSYKPRERLKQHLSASLSGTYGIHFATWASKLEVQVDFNIYRYSGIGNRAVQVIEDVLWDHLLPLLGRRGVK
jgi:hypothetical protein